MQQPGAVQLAKDGDHAAGPMHVFHMVFLGGGRDLAQIRYLPRHPVDVVHREIHPTFPRRRQQVQHGVGGTAHGDVEADGVLEGVEGGDAARQHRGVALLVIALGQLDDAPTGFQEQFPAVGVGGQQ